METAKVVCAIAYDTCDKFEHIISGTCSICGGNIMKHAKGYDEECPKCGAYIDWSNIEWAKDYEDDFIDDDVDYNDGFYDYDDDRDYEYEYDDDEYEDTDEEDEEEYEEDE